MAKISKELVSALEDLKREIRIDLKNLKDSLERDFRNELREIKANLKFTDDKFDDMVTSLKAVLEENKRLRTENDNLKSRCDQIESQTKSNESRIVDCEQYSRNANIEIKGIPVNANEKLTEIVMKLGDCIGEPISPSDIDVCHRVSVPGSRTGKNIIVQFALRRKRNAVLEKGKRKRLTASELGFSESVPIYVNEHLCPERKRLLAQAIAKKRETNWKFVWVRDGHIYARKSENSARLRITSSIDLNKMS